MKIFTLFIIPFFAFISFLWFCFSTFVPKEEKVFNFGKKEVKYDKDNAIKAFQKAITFKTFSYNSTQEFEGFYDHLENSFPLFHKHTTIKSFDHGKMFIWKGKNEKSEPILFLAHSDVVKITSEDNWEVDPFGGVKKVIDGEEFIYGRGTLDNKHNLVSMINSAEVLMKKGFQPTRTIYFCFAEDEETEESLGAREMAKYLEENEIIAIFAIDEGAPIVENKFLPFGVKDDIQMIGLAEKQFNVLELSIECYGGHSSFPTKDNSCIGLLSEAVSKIHHHKFEAFVDSPYITGFIREVFSRSSFLYKFIFSTLGKLGIGRNLLMSGKTTNPLIRTTVAPTIFRSGVQKNALPQLAKVTLSVRLIPHQTIDEVVEILRKVVNNPRIKFSYEKEKLNHKIACVDCAPYQIISETITQSAKTPVVIAPFLVVASTDLRYYKHVSRLNYNVMPTRLNENTHDIERIHSANERIKVSNYIEHIDFYHNLIENLELLK